MLTRLCIYLMFLKSYCKIDQTWPFFQKKRFSALQENVSHLYKYMCIYTSWCILMTYKNSNSFSTPNIFPISCMCMLFIPLTFTLRYCCPSSSGSRRNMYKSPVSRSWSKNKFYVLDFHTSTWLISVQLCTFITFKIYIYSKFRN